MRKITLLEITRKVSKNAIKQLNDDKISLEEYIVRLNKIREATEYMVYNNTDDYMGV